MQAGERRQATVLFADMVGYTAVIERLGEERSLAFTRMIYDRLTEAVQKHGGAVRAFGGDSVMAIFGVPDAQEDAALRACRTALWIQTAFAQAAESFEAAFNVRPQMRVGISSGSVVMASVEGETGPLTVVGNCVNLASRVQNLAPSGGCLICDATRRLVEGLAEVSYEGEHPIKGVSTPQMLWHLDAVREDATRFAASVSRGLGLHVGRDAELTSLLEALEASRGELRVADIVGDAGLGKTRLSFEFLQRVQDRNLLVLTGQCSASGQRTPFLPFIEVMRSAFAIASEDPLNEISRKLELGLRASGLHSTENLALLFNLLELDVPPGALDGMDGVLIGLRTRDLLPALLAERCRGTHVVILLEDIHWIDGASAELLLRLVEGGGQPNLMIIQTRRPLHEPPWCNRPPVTTLRLEPLAIDEIGDTVRAQLGVAELPDTLVRQLDERAGGNPLFAEELLNSLLHHGALRVTGDWVEYDDEIGLTALPESLQGLLTARMDRLEPKDRALLQVAATIGRRFDPGLLASIVGLMDSGAALQRLQTQGIVDCEPGSSGYAFRHALMRDTVYHSLLSDRRMALHLAVARALENRHAGRLSEIAQTLAHHYARTDCTDLAFTYTARAAASSLRVFSLGEANGYLASGLAIYRRDPACAEPEQLAAFLADYALWSNISLQVTTMLDLAVEVRPILDGSGDSREHAYFLHHYIFCLTWAGRYHTALDVQHELSAMADRLDDERALAYALVSEMALSCYCGQLSSEAFETRRKRAEALLADIDDAYLHNIFRAHLGWNAVTRGRMAPARDVALDMIVLGRRTNDPRALGYGTAMQALIAMMSNDYGSALGRAEQALDVSKAPFEKAIASAARHASRLVLGVPGAAAEAADFVAHCRQQGWGLFLAGPDTMLGIALVMDGRVGAGLRHIEGCIAEREGEGYQVAADWNRLTLCEAYLAILSGSGDASPGVLARNLFSLSGVVLFGPRRVLALAERARSNPQFDPDGHHIGHAEMVLGMANWARRRKQLAMRHLTAAQRIIALSGASPMLLRIETALAELAAR